MVWDFAGQLEYTTTHQFFLSIGIYICSFFFPLFFLYSFFILSLFFFYCFNYFLWFFVVFI
jgi:hypothetical protein